MARKADSPVKLAILDDYASIVSSKFSHLSDRIEIHSFSETLNARTPSGASALVDRLKDFTVVSTMRERTAFPGNVLRQLPNLKLLLTTGMRNASIDMQTCREMGITVAGTRSKPNSTQGYDATNEQTWALILGLAKNIARDDYMVKNIPSAWQSDLNVGLAGKTLGLLGLGKLGLQCAITGKLGFGMHIICWSRSLTQATADEAAEASGLPKGSFRVVESKLELFEQADVVSVHYVLSERSIGIVGEEELRAMKSNAMLINTSRGPLVDEPALLRVLEEGKIYGVALDVFNLEPLSDDSPWRSTKWGQKGKSRVLLTPHMGYVEEETMHSWYEQTAENLERWLDTGNISRKIESS